MQKLSMCALTLLVLTGSRPSDAKKFPTCPAARYLLAPGDTGLIFEDPAANAVTLGSSSLSIDPCGSTHAKVKGQKSGTKLNAKWKTCAGKKKIVVTGTLTNGCTSLSGTVKAKKVPKKTFTGTISTGCGDDLIDPGLDETCETNADCEVGSTCQACSCVADLPTTTTVVSSTTTTTTPACGDGAVGSNEECDYASPDAPPGCTTSCTVCGNSTTTAPEACDDGNLVSGDGCDANCRPTACGNEVVAGTETCDDGNTDNNDDCPSDCSEEACTPDTATVVNVEIHWAAPSAVAGLTVLVDYPENAVDLPGNGANIQAGTLDGFPSGTSKQGNDLGNQGHALREVVTKATAITPRPGTLFVMHLNGCAGVPAPVAGAFTCTVLQAFAPDGITPVVATCSVVIP